MFLYGTVYLEVCALVSEMNVRVMLLSLFSDSVIL